MHLWQQLQPHSKDGYKRCPADGMRRGRKGLWRGESATVRASLKWSTCSHLPLTPPATFHIVRASRRPSATNDVPSGTPGGGQRDCAPHSFPDPSFGAQCMDGLRRYHPPNRRISAHFLRKASFQQTRASTVSPRRMRKGTLASAWDVAASPVGTSSRGGNGATPALLSRLRAASAHARGVQHPACVS